MEKNWIEEFGNPAVIVAYKERMLKFQVGGEVPAPQGQGMPAQQQPAPQGGQTVDDPEQLLAEFIQAVQANNIELAKEIAFKFTSIIAEQAMAQQQQAQATPAMRNGGIAPQKKVFKSKTVNK